VGGGIAGCSVAFHLARNGWTDCLLLEKGELTSGSTWHAAGLCTQFNASRTITKLLMRSLELYDELRTEDGADVGLKRVGSVRLAFASEALSEFKARHATARTLGLPFELIGPADVASLFPLAETDGIIGAAYLPTDGYVDPSMTTHTLAAAARSLGVGICRRTPVRSLRQTKDGWLVTAGDVEIECEHLVIAAGQWSRKVGELAGVRLPIVPLQHQYVVTEQLDEVSRLAVELPVLRDPRGSFYARQEAGGLMIGPFEPRPLDWMIHEVPDEFEGRLLPGNLDQIMGVMVAAARRIPVLENAGLKHVINGPDAYTPDGRCLMGPVPGRRGLFVLAGFSIFGIVFGGGAGAYAAEWLMDGQPSESMWDLDVRRFGPFAEAPSYVVARAKEVYEREYAIHFPGEELNAGRPLKTDPLYERLASRGAVFGARFGWERPLWFACDGEAPIERYSFTQPNWQDRVAGECRSVRSAVGVLDQTSFAKFEVSGRGALAALDRLCANRLPHTVGRIALTQMLTARGGIECDVTVSRIAEDRFYVVSAAATEQHDLAWIQSQLPSDGSVCLENVTARLGVLTLAGPRSRELLERLCSVDISHAAFPFFTVRELDVSSVPCRAMRLSYVGELGFELHHPLEYSRALYDAIVEVGSDLGLVDFGYRALESMRLEKGYRLWGADIVADYNPIEAGFETLIDWDKEFIGKDALLAAGPTKQRLVTLHYAHSRRLEAHEWAPVLVGERPISWTLAGGWGYTIDRGVCLAYVPLEDAHEGRELAVEIIGDRVPVTVTLRPLLDPGNERVRS
jgi:4-methylaminobutanoate oxidase (formaldehyde-forming)